MKKLWKSVKPLIVLVLLLGFFVPLVKISADLTNEDAADNGGSTGGGSTTGGMQYFGGKITTMVPCTCSNGDQLTIILGGKSGTYLYKSGVKTYGSHMVIPGVWSLGGYEGGGTCMVGEKPYCTTLPISKGTISFIGTSYP
jgi:uncharacterized membrane protein